MSTTAQVICIGVLLGLVYTLAGLGLTVSLGVLRILNLTHGVMVISGAFFAYDLLQAWHLDPLLGAVIALPVFSAVGFVLERLVVRRARRRSEESVLLALFGAMIALQSIAILIWTANSRSITVSYTNARVSFGGVTLPADYLVAGGAALAMLLAVHAVLRFTFAGRAVQALSQNADAARILGINVDWYRSVVFALSVGIAAASGALLADVFPFSVQDQSQWLAYAFIVVLVGGTGRVLNALAGGLALGLAQAVFNRLLPLNVVDVVVYGLLAVALIARGGGLVAQRERSL